MDSISGVNDVPNQTGLEWIISSTAPVFAASSSFALSGDQTATFTLGRRVKTTNTGGTIYGTVTSSAFTTSTAVGIATDSGALDSGLSAVSYGLLSTPNGSVPWTNVSTTGLNLKSTTVIASIVSQGGSITTGPFVANSTAIFNSTAVFTKLVDVSSSTAGQIAFTSSNPSTSATVLDDYREIPWSPAITFGGASTGATFITRVGSATKTGNRVLVDYDVQFSGLGSASGQAALVNLPGPPNSSCLTPVGAIDWINMGTAMVVMTLSGPTSSGTAAIRGLAAAGVSMSTLTNANFSSTTDIRGSLSYFV
jgi:hypothetical protein